MRINKKDTTFDMGFNPTTLILILLFIVIVIAVWIWNTDIKSYFTHSGGTEGGCCSAKNAGCACRNPNYFKFVKYQGGRSTPVDKLEGILIDSRCYALTRDNYTNSHSFPPKKDKVAKGCATACAKSGVPVALLLGDLPPGPKSEAIVLLHPSPNLAKHMEKQARVSGYFMKDMKAIFTTCVEVRNTDGKWEDVCFTTPMISMVGATEGFSSEVTFEKDIKGLFREMDIESMKSFGIDFSKYENVRDNAERIFQRVADGSMPCDEPWGKDKVDLFKSWMDSGMEK